MASGTAKRTDPKLWDKVKARVMRGTKGGDAGDGCARADTTAAAVVISAARTAIEALGSDIPKPHFVDLLAGFELFTRTGTALPEETVEYVAIAWKVSHYHCCLSDPAC